MDCGNHLLCVDTINENIGKQTYETNKSFRPIVCLKSNTMLEPVYDNEKTQIMLYNIK